jgi:hypothetical protein
MVVPFGVLGDAGAPDIASGRPVEPGFGRRAHADTKKAIRTPTVNEPASASNQVSFESRDPGAMATSDNMLLRADRHAGFVGRPRRLTRNAGRSRVRHSSVR